MFCFGAKKKFSLNNPLYFATNLQPINKTCSFILEFLCTGNNQLSKFERKIRNENKKNRPKV